MKADIVPGAADPSRDLPLGKIVLLLVGQTVAFVGMGMGLWHFTGRDLANFLVPTAAGAFQGIALGGAFILSAWLVFNLLPDLADRLVRLQVETYRFLGPHLPTWAIVVISLCAGIGEEALFRAGLQMLLADYVGTVAAITLSSAAFALFHLGKPLITALLFVIGALFGMVYWLTDSLLAVVIGHVLYDIWALRYLHRSFLRLGLIDGAATEPGPLAKPVDAG